jgi:hypothetical protein
LAHLGKQIHGIHPSFNKNLSRNSIRMYPTNFHIKVEVARLIQTVDVVFVSIDVIVEVEGEVEMM